MNSTDWIPPAVRKAATDRRLRAGETLFRSGDRATGLYGVVSGKVRLVRVDRNGHEAVLQTAIAGETFAEASLFSLTYHCDAVAASRTVVRLYPKRTFIGELKRDPKLTQAFMQRLAEHVMALRTRLERRNIRSARDRIRHFLTLNAGADGRTVSLPGTLRELAADLGLSEEALYRTLARMAADGEIRRSGGTIRIEKNV